MSAKAFPKKAGKKNKALSVYGLSKQMNDALNAALDRRGLRQPMGSHFGSAKKSRYVE